MQVVKLRSGGLIDLPKEVIKQLHLKEGIELKLETRTNMIILHLKPKIKGKILTYEHPFFKLKGTAGSGNHDVSSDKYKYLAKAYQDDKI